VINESNVSYYGTNENQRILESEGGFNARTSNAMFAHDDEDEAFARSAGRQGDDILSKGLVIGKGYN
jgi:hypothetical protein